MTRRKSPSPAKPETPILAYTSQSNRGVTLPASCMKMFSLYSEYFSDKTNYEVKAEDVLSAKANDLFTNPDRINVPKEEEQKSQEITLPNSAWAGLEHAAKHHDSSIDKVIETIAAELHNDEQFNRWYKRKIKDKKKDIH